MFNRTLNKIFIVSGTIILFGALILCACRSSVKKEISQVDSPAKSRLRKDSKVFPYKHKNTMMGVDTMITVSYAATACTCAQWAINTGAGPMPDNREQIYLEPANKKITDAEHIWDGQHLPLKLQVSGRFYKEIGYPDEYNPAKGPGEPARVYRYDKIKILSKYFKNETHWGVNTE